MALLFRVSGFFGLVSTSHVNYTCILGLQRRLQISRVRAHYAGFATQVANPRRNSLRDGTVTKDPVLSCEPSSRQL